MSGSSHDVALEAEVALLKKIAVPFIDTGWRQGIIQAIQMMEVLHAEDRHRPGWCVYCGTTLPCREVTMLRMLIKRTDGEEAPSHLDEETVNLCVALASEEAHVDGCPSNLPVVLGHEHSCNCPVRSITEKMKALRP